MSRVHATSSDGIIVRIGYLSAHGTMSRVHTTGSVHSTVVLW